MKVVTPEISWHERDPIYSIDFQPGGHSVQRIASGGVDKIVRIWQMTLDEEGKGNVEFLANLRRHTATVNVVRFSKNGELLASAGDDSSILLWKQSDVPMPANNIFADDEAEECKESWVCHKTLRGHLGDVADMSWSNDNRFLVSGSVDNSAIVWDVKKAQKLAFFNEHKSYVQGVAFDPLGEYIATLSSDRSLRIYSLASKNIVNNVSKMPPIVDGQTQSDTKPKHMRIFQDDSLRSFFRRLEFTSDGQLLLTPAGCVEIGDKVVSSSFVFVRGAFARPALYLPSGDKSTTVVRANPQLFELHRSTDSTNDVEKNQKECEKDKTLFSLPYRMVYAVASEDYVLLYDTQQKMPIALLKNIHYHQISDMSWSSDGKALVVSSTDGFCTIITFADGELGVPWVCSHGSRQGKTEISSDNLKDAGIKEQMCEALSSKMLEATRESDKIKMNTNLNIRRVGKSPKTEGGPSGKLKTIKNEQATISMENDSNIGSESSIKGEGKNATEINTSLNIRKVSKDGSKENMSVGKKNETAHSESLSGSTQVVDVDSSSRGLEKSSVNANVNVVFCGEKTDEPSPGERTGNKDELYTGQNKSSGVSKEKTGTLAGTDPAASHEEKDLQLSAKIDKVHIEDCPKEDALKMSDLDRESFVASETEMPLRQDGKLEETPLETSRHKVNANALPDRDGCHSNQENEAKDGQKKRRIQITTLKLND